jgi:hypothetical protein
MSKRRRRIAKSYNDQLMAFVEAYQKLHPGAVGLLSVAKWAHDRGLWKPRTVHPATLLAKDLKKAARESRVTDPQQRKLRAWLPAKIERMDINGNQIFDVVWDHIFEMSAHHALLFLSQQYENIEKQCCSHNRVRSSVVDNNPNCRELQLGLFDYDFRYATGESQPQVVERIRESAVNSG